MSKPAHQSNVITEMAWVDFLHWAIGDRAMRAQFEAETGLKLSAPATAIEALVDEATGSHRQLILAFARWATKTYYGTEYIPEAARKMLEEDGQ